MAKCVVEGRTCVGIDEGPPGGYMVSGSGTSTGLDATDEGEREEGRSLS